MWYMNSPVMTGPDLKPRISTQVVLSDLTTAVPEMYRIKWNVF